MFKKFLTKMKVLSASVATAAAFVALPVYAQYENIGAAFKGMSLELPAVMNFLTGVLAAIGAYFGIAGVNGIRKLGLTSSMQLNQMTAKNPGLALASSVVAFFFAAAIQMTGGSMFGSGVSSTPIAGFSTVGPTGGGGGE